MIVLLIIACRVFHALFLGNPKPVCITHLKATLGSLMLQSISLKAEDKVYTPLPLYHSAGGSIGMMGATNAGRFHIIIAGTPALAMEPSTALCVQPHFYYHIISYNLVAIGSLTFIQIIFS